MSRPFDCPKCGGGMEVGWLADNAYHSWRFLTWCRGAPELSPLGAVKAPADPLPVLAYRCRACGFLEMYATGDGVTGPAP